MKSKKKSKHAICDVTAFPYLVPTLVIIVEEAVFSGNFDD